MSRDTFNHADVRIADFAEDLDQMIAKEPEDRYPLEPYVVDKLREIAAQAHRVAALAKEAEWLYSGDTGPDTFMQRVAEIESPRGVKVEV
jgi:hypothetical protein